MENKEAINKIPRKFLIFVILLGFLLIIGIASFKFIKDISFKNALIRTLETLAFMYQETEGMGKALEIFLSLFGVFMIWWVLWSIFDILLEGELGEYLKMHSFLSKIRKMRNHYIIAGGGRFGEEIALKLKEKKQLSLIIEKDEKIVDKLKKKGFLAEFGDVTSEEVLKEANIKTAKVLILSLPEIEKNLLVTMTAKELNPEIEIYARCDKPAFVSKLKKAGAKVVVVPEIEAADKIINELK